MEGTTIGRAGSSEGFATENELEWQFVQAFRGTPGAHFVWTSTQNIDRLVTIFRAAKRTGRTLVIGLYTAVVLETTARDTIPQSDWEGVNLYVPHRQRVHIMRNGLFQDLHRHGMNRIYPEDLPTLGERAVMLFTPAMIGDWGVEKVLEGAHFTYSMWDGYLAEPGTQGWSGGWKATESHGRASTRQGTLPQQTFSGSPMPFLPTSWFPFTPSRETAFRSCSTTSCKSRTACGGKCKSQPR